jgi:hypothetical protein
MSRLRYATGAWAGGLATPSLPDGEFPFNLGFNRGVIARLSVENIKEGDGHERDGRN